MRRTIFIALLLGYVAANERLTPNQHEEYQKNTELVRQKRQQQTWQYSSVDTLQCTSCKIFSDKLANQYSTSGQGSANTYSQGGNGAVVAYDDATNAASYRGTTRATYTATNVASNKATNAVPNRRNGADVAYDDYATNSASNRGTSTATNRATPTAINRATSAVSNRGNGAVAAYDDYATNAASNRGSPTAANRATNAVPNRASNDAEYAATHPVPLPQGDNALYKFHQKLFREIAPIHAQRNVIYSPLSLNTLLAMLYIGAYENTAYELQRTLELPENREQCAKEFQRILNTDRVEGGEAQLLMANKMYYNKALVINPAVNSYAQEFFKAEVEPINFAKTPAAMRRINNWVAGKTQQRIKNLIGPHTLDRRTSAILVNAVYLKAKWAKQFSAADTQKSDFYVSSNYKVRVDMMYNEDTFPYAELDDLKAAALELPFKDTDLSMLIVLPYEKNGLRALEERLSNVDLSTLLASMKSEWLAVGLPKFSIEYEQNMVEPLIKTGINELFSSHANLTGFFAGHDQPLVSKVQHKAFINVNEAGAEAAAASFAKFIPLSMYSKPKAFTADHPFVFIIHSPNAVYFAGHVVHI